MIFIHGVTLRAGVFLGHKEYFMKQGYKSSELYATTYADGGYTPMYYCSMKCEDVKIVCNQQLVWVLTQVVLQFFLLHNGFGPDPSAVAKKFLISSYMVLFKVREFIEAVYKYSNSKVDIIAYSMGAAITRKAILGGKCVDNDIDLGSPITNKVVI